MPTGLDIANRLVVGGVRVYYTGKNVARGWFALQCPWCPDPSAHLVVNEQKGNWRCWRCGRKGGPRALIKHFRLQMDLPAYIINDPLSTREVDLGGYVAKAFTYRTHTFLPVPDPLDAGMEEAFANQFTPLFLDGCRNPIIPPVVWDYLKERGVSEVVAAAHRFAYTDRGPMAMRIVVPVHYHGRVANYLGRDITGRARKRYRYCTSEEAVMSLSSLLWNYDGLVIGNPEIIYICEGVFDALAFWPTGTCTFTSSTSPLQALLCAQIGAKELRVCYDRGALDNAMRAARLLASVHPNVSVWRVQGVKDPADLWQPLDNLELVMRV